MNSKRSDTNMNVRPHYQTKTALVGSVQFGTYEVRGMRMGSEFIRLLIGLMAACGSIGSVANAQSNEPDRVQLVAQSVDRLVDKRLQLDSLPASPPSDDSEFLRRVTLDLTGRVPTYDESVKFLASDDPGKRRKLIDDLLAREAYGLHFAAIWRELIEPRETGSKKGPRDTFSPWLARQFNSNRGWNKIVADLLTAEGRIRDRPQSRFILANSENFEPQPNMLTDSTARLFWGIQLRCAECHDHPFAPWKQTEFWATAAFFSRLRKGYGDGKNPQGWTLTETRPDEPLSQKFTKLLAADDVAGPAIVVPSAAGELADGVVRARFLGGDETGWTDDGPFRQRFAAWATSPDHPWFAANAANRMWAHLFGRGLVTPLDDQRVDNPGSHPQLLKLLAAELVESGFDLKHLIRIICNSNAYQRTSRPLAKNKNDNALFSHMSVKVISPGALHDSLSVVLYPVAPKTGSGTKPPPARLNPIPGVDRREFVRFFAARPDDNVASIVNQGIPQFLRLMNGPALNNTPPGVARFVKGRQRDDIVEALFLAAYSRRPTADEVKAASDFLDSSREAEPAAGLLWVLLNSSEFVLNH